jgi:hypothetical protein
MSGHNAARDFIVSKRVDETFAYRAPHAGLIRSDSLRKIGGYYGGFRVGWDTLLTNMILMTGSISWTSEPLYYRLVRVDSLTHSTHTGAESEYASRVSACLRTLYRDCYEAYRCHQAGMMSRNLLSEYIKQISQRYVSEDERLALSSEARRLRGMMS